MTRKAVIAGLDELLKPLGFSQQKSTWNRRVGSVIDAIDTQVSKAGDMITVNAGVLDRDVHAKLWGQEPPSFIEVPSCTVRARVGELIDGIDQWWPLISSSTSADIVKAVETYAIPFIKRVHTRDAMEAWLEQADVVRKKYPPAILSLIIVKNELGHRKEACALLSSLRPKVVGAWRVRIDEVGARLGCT